MKRLSIVALVGLPLLLTVACASPGRLVGVTIAPSSSVPTHNWAPATACEDSNRNHGNTVVMVDWVDFVQLSGTEYIAGLDGLVPPVASTQLGAVIGRVRCQLSALNFSEMPGPNVDGDAAFLPIGTAVHAIDGYEPSCRVAARIDGANRVYLAHRNVGGYSKAVPCVKAP